MWIILSKHSKMFGGMRRKEEEKNGTIRLSMWLNIWVVVQIDKILIKECV